VQLITAIGVVTLGVTLVPASVTAGWPGPVGLRIAAAVEAILRYVPVQFFIEAVSFRGLLDAHVHRAGAAVAVRAVRVGTVGGVAPARGRRWSATVGHHRADDRRALP
jgi:hypothetical protein